MTSKGLLGAVAGEVSSRWRSYDKYVQWFQELIKNQASTLFCNKGDIGGFSSERLLRFVAPKDGLAFLNWRRRTTNQEQTGHSCDFLLIYLLWGSPDVNTGRSPEQSRAFMLASLCFFLLQDWERGQSGSWGWGLPGLVAATSPQLKKNEFWFQLRVSFQKKGSHLVV